MKSNQFISLFFAICVGIVLLVPIVLDIRGKDAIPFLGVAIMLFGISFYNLGMALVDSKIEEQDIKHKKYKGSRESKKDVQKEAFLKMKIP